MRKIAITVALDPEQYETLKKFAYKSNLSQGEIMRRALEKELKEMEQNGIVVALPPN